MLNRRHIRIKVMQVLYAFRGTESDDFSKDQKFLLHSIDNMYNLYLLLISLLIEVQKRAENHLEKSSKKHLATAEEKNPNRKFINNEVQKQLKEKLDKDYADKFSTSKQPKAGNVIDLDAQIAAAQKSGNIAKVLDLKRQKQRG